MPLNLPGDCPGICSCTLDLIVKNTCHFGLRTRSGTVLSRLLSMGRSCKNRARTVYSLLENSKVPKQNDYRSDRWTDQWSSATCFACVRSFSTNACLVQRLQSVHCLPDFSVQTSSELWKLRFFCVLKRSSFCANPDDDTTKRPH